MPRTHWCLYFPRVNFCQCLNSLRLFQHNKLFLHRKFYKYPYFEHRFVTIHNVDIDVTKIVSFDWGLIFEKIQASDRLFQQKQEQTVLCGTEDLSSESTDDP